MVVCVIWNFFFFLKKNSAMAMMCSLRPPPSRLTVTNEAEQHKDQPRFYNHKAVLVAPSHQSAFRDDVRGSGDNRCTVSLPAGTLIFPPCPSPMATYTFNGCPSLVYVNENATCEEQDNCNSVSMWSTTSYYVYLSFNDVCDYCCL